MLTMCIVFALLLFIGAICVVASSVAIMLCFAGMFVLLIPIFCIVSSMLSPAIFIVCSFCLIAILLGVQHTKNKQKNPFYMLIIAIPCAYIAYLLYKSLDEFSFLFYLPMNRYGHTDYIELFTLASIAILCVVFCITHSKSTNKEK